MRCTLREHQLDCALCEGNDVMLHGLEVVDVFVDAVCTQTDLAAVTELLDGVLTAKVTCDELLRLDGGSGHSKISITSKTYKYFCYIWCHRPPQNLHVKVLTGEKDFEGKDHLRISRAKAI
jgi:hypothetical protein